MPDYLPFDLTPFCNSGVGVVSSTGEAPATGPCVFRGLPFAIAEGERCFILFRAGSAEKLSIPIGSSVRHILVAHRQLESQLHEGDPVGRLIAHYRFVFADGQVVEAPIRERFEIGYIPPGWGELPFTAVPDAADALQARYEGHWSQAGQRQTEANQASPVHYYLWDWENPRPDAVVEHLEIIPAADGRDFIVAAVTLGFLDEDPFGRSAAVPVHITLPQAEDAASSFALEVEVDRGVATYPYPLPTQGAEEFLEDSFRGFGESLNRASSPAYVEIAATPSATVTVRQSGDELGSVQWGDLEEKGVVEQPRLRLEVVDTGRNWVHTTILDDETGKPVPCRVHFRSLNGIPYAPHGHHAHVHSNLGTWHIDIGGDLRLGQISYAYIDGRCQGWLPRGEVIVDAARGFEYEPLRTRVEIKPGQRELTLRLRRHSNLNAQRYFSGDTHVHFLSTQGALTEAAGEDLDVVNLLLSQWGHLFTNTEEFIGAPVPSGDRQTIVYATQENRQHLLGHLTLLGLKEPVMPWCSDGPSEAEMGGNLETTLSRWADACHAQGGTVVIPHLPNPNAEPAALIATGRADAVEMLVHAPYNHLEYYRYLNGGYRLPLAGGTDKMDSGVPVGLYRTYAYIPPDQEFNYENWLRALRSGNSFLSGGPLLEFTVDGQPMGSTLHLRRGGGTVEVVAVATSIFPIHSLQIVQGGEVVASTEETAGARRLEIRTRIAVGQATWLCARCAGPGYTAIRHHDSWGRGIMAHTSPVYISCDGEYDVCSPETMQYMLTLVDGSLQHIRRRARQWKPGAVTHHHGQEDHGAFLEEPFHQAIAAIHQKMHEHGIPH